MILIVASEKDVASLNIRKTILSNHDFKRKGDFQSNPLYEARTDGKYISLITLDTESIYAQNLPQFFTNLELVIFVSRHSSLSGKPTLSVHTPGNLGKAEMGGIAKTVSVSPANAMIEALKIMNELRNEMNLNYEVCYEGTHHGPSLDVPTMFTELGSSKPQWNDMKAAEAVAQAAVRAAERFGTCDVKTVIGIGGPHYNAKFTRMALQNQLAFGHIIPKYAVQEADLAMLKQCIKKTKEKVETIILDWKGIRGQDKTDLLRILAETGVPFEKS